MLQILQYAPVRKMFSVQLCDCGKIDIFDYEEYKKNGFKVKKLGDFSLKLETKPE